MRFIDSPALLETYLAAIYTYAIYNLCLFVRKHNIMKNKLILINCTKNNKTK